MTLYLSRDEVRSLDRLALEEYGVPGVVLLENAGRSAAEILVSLGVGGPVVLCCGKGNNGGDGLVMARHLDNRGVAVRVLVFARAEELSRDAAVAYGVVARSGIPLVVEPGPEVYQAELAGAAWVVDALFGTGLTGPIRPPLDRVVEAINACAAPVVAVDIPSGLDCDTGQPFGPAVRARHTITFVAPKKGFAEAAARPWLGQLHVADIGAPRHLLARFGLGGRPPGTNP